MSQNKLSLHCPCTEKGSLGSSSFSYFGYEAMHQGDFLPFSMLNHHLMRFTFLDLHDGHVSDNSQIFEYMPTVKAFIIL